jgi:hypothetical protein
MRELLEKYKSGTLTSANEQDLFVHELLEIKAQRDRKKRENNTTEAIQPKSNVVSLDTLFRRATLKKFFALAACILFACFAFWKFDANSTIKNEEFANIESNSKDITEITEKLVNNSIGVDRGSSSQSDDLSKMAVDLNFKGIVQELKGKTPMTEKENLLIGVAYANLTEPKFDAALEHLNQVNSSNYTQNITMLKVICNVELGQKGQAKRLLQTILADDQYGEDHLKLAKSLLEKLKSEK